MRASRINIFLLERGLTQRELSRRLNIHYTNVSSLFSGRLVVPAQLDAIAAGLGITRRKLDSLIGADAPGRRAA